MSANSLLAGLAPTHPGEILREDILPAINMTKTAVAERLHVSRQTLYDILAERQPVTPAMALRLERLFNSSAEFWVNLQRDYDLRTLKSKMADELAEIRAVEMA